MSSLPSSMGMKVPAIIAEAKSALEAGHCVVIGLQTTGEVGLRMQWSNFVSCYLMFIACDTAELLGWLN